MSDVAQTHRQSASDFGQSAQATLERATDVGYSLRAVVEVGLGLIQIGLAIEQRLGEISRHGARRG